MSAAILDKVFADLLLKHEVPTGDELSIDKLCSGINRSKCAFVNLPISIQAGKHVFPRVSSDPTWKHARFVVCQRWHHDIDNYATYYGQYPLTDVNFLGPRLNDLSLLDQLLSGETLLISDVVRIGGNWVPSPDCWIKITLKR